MKHGISHVPEGCGIIAPLDVEDNLLVGAYGRRRVEAKESLKQIYARFRRLAERRRQKAGLLSGGEQQMLSIGRALMARPRVLLLDEPSMGLAPLIVNEIFALLSTLKAEGLAILLVEQNARKALATADRGYLLEEGRVRISGPSSLLVASPHVVEAYLGGLKPRPSAHVSG